MLLVEYNIIQSHAQYFLLVSVAAFFLLSNYSCRNSKIAITSSLSCFFINNTNRVVVRVVTKGSWLHIFILRKV